MVTEPESLPNLSPFLRYLAALPNSGDERIPSLADLSQQLGISIASLREQLEVARMMGIVEVKPKTGIRRLPYTFQPAVTTSLAYAISKSPDCFTSFSDLRKHLEVSYFIEAAQLLTAADLDNLDALILRAQSKMNQSTSHAPAIEHRDFHLLIYRRLENPFVNGIFESYWDLYRAAGLEYYPDAGYLQRLWQYHARILESIKNRDFTQGLKVLTEHMELLKQRVKNSPRQSFE